MTKGPATAQIAVEPCSTPLPNGTPCHVCRLRDALLAAEHDAGDNPHFLNIERCLDALAEVTGHLLAEWERDDALDYLQALYATSRQYRARHTRDDPLAHAEGHA